MSEKWYIGRTSGAGSVLIFSTEQNVNNHLVYETVTYVNLSSIVLMNGMKKTLDYPISGTCSAISFSYVEKAGDMKFIITHGKNNNIKRQDKHPSIEGIEFTDDDNSSYHDELEKVCDGKEYESEILDISKFIEKTQKIVWEGKHYSAIPLKGKPSLRLIQLIKNNKIVDIRKKVMHIERL